MGMQSLARLARRHGTIHQKRPLAIAESSATTHMIDLRCARRSTVERALEIRAPFGIEFARRIARPSHLPVHCSVMPDW